MPENTRVIHDTRGEPNEAIAHYQRALEQLLLRPESGYPRKHRHGADQRRDTEEAFREFQEALSCDKSLRMRMGKQ